VAATDEVAAILRPGQLVVLESTTYPAVPSAESNASQRPVFEPGFMR
jgi:UDP-N-acetyl-D-mannosaminuronate dehydrogenase